MDETITITAKAYNALIRETRRRSFCFGVLLTVGVMIAYDVTTDSESTIRKIVEANILTGDEK